MIGEMHWLHNEYQLNRNLHRVHYGQKQSFCLQIIMGHVMFDRPDAMLEKQVTLWAYGHKIYRAELFRFKDRECIMDEIYLCVLI